MKSAQKEKEVIARDCAYQRKQKTTIEQTFANLEKKPIEAIYNFPLPANAAVCAFEIINADIAPGVKVSGGIVSHILSELEISCLPKDLPEFISVDLSNLTVINSLHLSDLGLPKGVEIPSLIRGENLPVATIIIPRAVAAEEASAVVAAADIPTTVQKKDADVKEADKKDSGKKK